MSKSKWPVVGWAGMTPNIHRESQSDNYDNPGDYHFRFCIFTSKEAALKRYESVQKVLIWPDLKVSVSRGLK